MRIAPPSQPNTELDALLARARNAPPMTAAEVRLQRISFTYGQLVDCTPDATKAQVAAVHDEIYRSE